MDIEIKNESKTKKKVTITISVEEMEEYLSEAANNLSKEMDIKGFRPGKAPREMIENSLGKEKFWQEASRIAVEKTYPEAIKKNNLFPISQPEIEFLQLAPGNPIKYKALFHVMPEFDLPEYKKIGEEITKNNKKEVEVDEKEVNQTIERIQESRAVSREVEREAKNKDEVKVTFTGKVDDKELLDREDLEFVLGNDQFSALEGFEDQIIGMKAGDNKNFTIEISKDDSNEQIAGKKINFDLELKSVAKKELPELTDEFASSLHKNVSDLKELKEKIEEGIKHEKSTKNEEKIKMEIVQELIKKTDDLEIPEVLVEKELDNMETKMERQIQQTGKTFEDYLEDINKSKEDLRNEWQKKAEDNVAAALILHKIAEAEEITVSEEEVEKELDKHFKVSNKSKNDETEENIERLRSYIHDMKKNQKIFDFLMEE